MQWYITFQHEHYLYAVWFPAKICEFFLSLKVGPGFPKSVGIDVCAIVT